MNTFKRINNIVGWGVFLISAFTYLSTIEPTASWWDCSEFIASAFKLEVGHPPGAPLFMMIARIFTLFAFGDVSQVAKMVNIMSALSSAFTILFLFWTITLLARKYFISNYRINNDNYSTAQTIVIIGSGVVGALAYNFSDSFWFSAVEGEVYAMSSLFTALVFWAMLKWEAHSEEAGASRWIVLIAYLMGLSIGVHLLNLLTIPALALIFYFKKYDYSFNGFIKALVIGIVLLGLVQYGIIQGMVSLAGKFELLFVNGFGLPYWSGAFFYFFLLGAAVILGIYYSHKHSKALLNNVLVLLTVILIGYSSFALIVIRSQANTPLDENNPENLFSLLSYLNREQYGARPLIYGQYYNAPVVGSEPKYTYLPKDGKYIKTKQTNPEYKYDKKFMTIFPRMYSSQGSHKQGYKSWGWITTPDNEPPSFINNLIYFVRYQVNFMYMRYFMWNFAGRQNDIQGYGSMSRGNWISGFSLTDNFRLGNQKILPDERKNNKARNTYFLLPLILGLVGFFFYAFRVQKDNWVLFLLFFFTGLAIVIYVNQPPYQPRERDYSYVGSFYAFAMWIGLSVLALYETYKNKMNKKLLAIGLSVLFTVLGPGIMAANNWDDHDRSNRYTVRDLAADYLNSCAPNAVLFTYGDNDTFPLWYVQEVEGIRTDVRVVNLSLFATDWYIQQMERKNYKSEPLNFSLSFDQYIDGKRDYVPVLDQKEIVADQVYKANKEKYAAKYQQMYSEMMHILENSEFPKLYAQDWQTLQKGYTSMPFSTFKSLLLGLNKEENRNRTKIDASAIANLLGKSSELYADMLQQPLLLADAMKFVGSDETSTKIGTQSGEQLDYLPTNYVKIKVDKEKVLKNGTVAPKNANRIVDEIVWKIPNRYIYKNLLMTLDLIGNNNWERPIYFAVSVGSENYAGLDNYLRLDGFAYRLVPIKSDSKQGETGTINTDTLYNRLMERYTWGNVNSPDFFMDEQNKRTLRIINPRDIFNRLATQLIAENKKDSAQKVLDKLVEIFPDRQLPFDYYMVPIVENYYKIGQNEKADEVATKLNNRLTQWITYYKKLDPEFSSNIDVDKIVSLLKLYDVSNKYHKGLFSADVGLMAEAAMKKHFPFLAKLNVNDANFGQVYQSMAQSQRRTLAIYMQLIETLGAMN